jgi:hypothetical protein
MAVYEALLLNTVVPQIQAAQAGDSYVMVVNATTPALRITQTGTGNALEVEDSANPDATPFVVSAAGDVGIGTNAPTSIGSSKVVEISSTAGNSGFLLFSVAGSLKGSVYANTSETSIGSISATPLLLKTGDTTKATLDASGNLGLGVTPSAWLSTAKAFQFSTSGALWALNSQQNTLLSTNEYLDASAVSRYLATGFGMRYQQTDGQHRWLNAPSGTAGATTSITSGQAYSVTTLGSTTLGEWQTYFSALTGIPSIGQTVTATATGTLAGGATVTQIVVFTQAMTLDASGNLGIVTTSPSSFDAAARTLVVGTTSGNNGITIAAGSTGASTITFADGTTGGAQYTGYIDYQHNGDYMRFGTNGGTERARITSGGYFKASNSGAYNGAANSYHENYNSASDEWITWFQSAPATNPKGLRVYYSAAAPNGTANHFLYCDDTGGQRASIRSNGGLANYSANNVNLASDERLKKDISPLLSTWDKLKAVEVVNFRYKDCNEGDPLLFGVIAQQVQPIVPDLVVVTKEAQEAVEAKDAVLDADGNVVEPAVAAKEATPEYYGIREQPMYWLAIKALQEAMARIETLEAKIAALEAK